MQGSYLQVGDIVSLVDKEDSVYYAQIRGLLIDNYCEKSAFLTWLIPTQESPDPKYGFDPATYLIGKATFERIRFFFKKNALSHLLQDQTKSNLENCLFWNLLCMPPAITTWIGQHPFLCPIPWNMIQNLVAIYGPHCLNIREVIKR